MGILILLDVKNAFNLVEWKVILDALRQKNISLSLRRVTSSYLQDRKIIEGGMTYDMTAGVPQGSLLGPTLWNVAYDSVLWLKLPERAETIAYADDLALVVFAKTTEEIEEIIYDSLEEISKWMTQNSLKLAPEKGEAVVLTKNRKDRMPNIKLNGHTIEIKSNDLASIVT